MDTTTEIDNTDVYNSLKLGSYTYSAKTIDNYTLNSPTTQSVTLTEIFPNATLIFWLLW